MQPSGAVIESEVQSRLTSFPGACPGGQYVNSVGGSLGCVALPRSVSGSIDYIPKFTGSSILGNSIITASSSGVGIGGYLNVGSQISAGGQLIVPTWTRRGIAFQFDPEQPVLTTGIEQYSAADLALRIYMGTWPEPWNPYLAFGRYTDATNFSEYMRITKTGNVGIGTTVPSSQLEVAGTIRSRNLNALVASNASYTWAQLAAAGDSACPSGFHVAVALEALVRCYLDSASCRDLGAIDLWVSGNHDVSSCSRDLMSHSGGGDCWGGEGVSVANVARTNPGYHWVMAGPGLYAGLRGPSLGAKPDTETHKVLCVPNFQ